MAENASPPIPLKIWFPSRKIQIGIAARSLHHLRQLLRTKLGLSDKFKLTLDDGTIVCDPEYFRLLEHQTKLTVVEVSQKTAAVQTTTDAARKRSSPSVPASAAKRARFSHETQNCFGDSKTDLNSNHNNSQLLSKICISSVAGNVPMSLQPRATTFSPPVQQIAPWPMPGLQHNNGLPQQQPLFQPHHRLPAHQTVAVPPIPNQSFAFPTQNHPTMSQINWLPRGPSVEPCIPPLIHHSQEVCQQVRHHVPLYPPIPQQHLINQDRHYQMQVERQMRTTIQMSPPPHVLSPPPHLSSFPPKQPTPVEQPPNFSPHVIHYVDQLHTTKPTTPPTLLKVFISPQNTESKITTVATENALANVEYVKPQQIAPKLSSWPTTKIQTIQSFPQQTSHCLLQQQLPEHQTQCIAPPKSLAVCRPIPSGQPDVAIANKVPVKSTEDSDSEDEHLLHIVESEVCLLQSPPSPPQSSQAQTLPSPPQSSPRVHSPVTATTRRNKPANLNLLSQSDDGYWSTTTSSLGSADDVKRTLPFANFDDFTPLGNCHGENKRRDSGPENNEIGISSMTPGDNGRKDELLQASLLKQEITYEMEPSVNEGVGQCDHSDCVDSLVLTIPIKVIDGQIYYRQPGDTIKRESHKPRGKKIMVIDLENDSDADDVLSSQTGHSCKFSLSKTSLENNEKAPTCESSSGDSVTEAVVVAEHAAEVPVVTTPMDSTTFNIDRCVAEVIDVMKDRGRLQTQPVLVEENVLLESSDLAETYDLMMGNEVVVSLEGSSQSLDFMDSNELVSSLLLHNCLPKNGSRVSSSS